MSVVEQKRQYGQPAAQGAAPPATKENEVFISYSRKDVEFVRRLDAALAEQGKDTYVDWEIRPWSRDWQQELYEAIDGADTFLCVLSENSLASRNVALELDHAVLQGKRIKPIQIGRVKDEDVPSTLMKPQWTDFRDPDHFDEALAELIEALDTDADWVHMHTKVLVAANEWEQSGEDKSFLLRRTTLASAEEWLTQQAGKEPAATDLQLRYVAASRKEAARRRQKGFGAVLFALAVAIVLAVFALVQRSAAITQSQEAERQARVAQSRELASLAEARLSLDPELSLLLASEAARRAETQEARHVLEQALLVSPVRASFGARAGPLTSVSFSGDGTLLLTADAKAARLWDVETGEPAGVFPGSHVNGAAFDPANKRVAVAQDEGGIEIWSVSGGRIVRRLPGDAWGDNAVTFATEKSPRWVVSAGLTGTTHVFELASGRRTAAFKLDANAQSASMSPDGKRVVVAYVDGPTRIWNVASEREVVSLDSQGAWTAAFSSDGKYVVTADADHARIWDAETGKLVRRLPGTGSVGIVSAAFSPDDELVATGGGNGEVRIWEASTGRQVTVLRGHADEVTGVAFSADGAFVASASDDGTARVWKIDKGRDFTRIGSGEERFGSFSWDGRHAVTYGPGGALTVWPVERRARPTSLPVPPTDRAFFSRNNERLMVFTGSGIELWRVGSWTRVGRLPPETNTATSASLSADNRFLVTANQRDVAVVWDVATGNAVRKLTCKEGGAWAVDFSVARQYLVTVCLEEVVVWDASGRSPSSWTPVERIPGGTDPYFAGNFSIDSQFLLLSQTNQVARVLRVGDWREQSTLVMQPLEAYTFSGTHDLIVALNSKGAAGAWDIPGGRRLPLVGEVRRRIADVSFTPDERAVLVAFEDGVVRRYDCDICAPLDELVKLAEDRATRELSPEERRLFLHET